MNLRTFLRALDGALDRVLYWSVGASLVLLAGILLTGCASTQPDDARSKECAAQGGCATVTAKELENALVEAFLTGLSKGRQMCGRDA